MSSATSPLPNTGWWAATNFMRLASMAMPSLIVWESVSSNLSVRRFCVYSELRTAESRERWPAFSTHRLGPSYRTDRRRPGGGYRVSTSMVGSTSRFPIKAPGSDPVWP